MTLGIQFLKIFAITCVVFYSNLAICKEIYIDFESGDDDNSGLTQDNPWKHAPGDPAAEDEAEDYKPEPGDILLFKGGVEYLGSIVLEDSGDPQRPIVYKGDGWGKEQAILSGAETVDVSFRPCASKDDCYNNENWVHLFKADLDKEIDPLSPLFISGERQWLAKTPNQPDPFWFDDITHYIPVDEDSLQSSFTARSLKLSDEFALGTPESWKGAFFALWMKPNTVVIRQISEIDEGSKTVFFNLVENDPYTDRESFFSVFNRPDDIDRAGEYIVKDGAVILWPSNPELTKHTRLHTNKRFTGININGQSNITIEGFRIKHFYGEAEGWNRGAAILNKEGPSKNIIVRKNTISDLKSVEGTGVIQLHHMENAVVEDNIIENNQKNSGIRLAYSKNSIIRNNTVRRIGRTGIRLIENDNVEISGNYLTDIRGGHGNGMSIYLKNKDILVASNVVEKTPSAFTFHGTGNPSEATGLWLLNNIFLGRVNSWGQNYSSVHIMHNLFLAPDERGKSLQIPGRETSLVVVNNIIDGMLNKPQPADWNISHNIYTDLSWTQSRQYKWFLEPGGDVDRGLAEPLMTYSKSPAPVSRAVGENIGQYLPVQKFKQFDFSPWQVKAPIGPNMVPAN